MFFTFGGLWGGPYLMQVHGMTRQQAGHVLSMPGVGMVVGSPAVSPASNRVFRARKPVMMWCSAVTVGITAALALFTDTLPVAALYAVCLGLGVFSSAIVVVGFTVAGYRAAFMALAGCALVALVASAFLKETLSTAWK